MDFVYDKLQVAADTPGTAIGDVEGTSGDSTTTVSDQTQQSNTHERKQSSSIDIAADKLETGIENAYTRLSNAATNTNWSSLWATVKKQGENALKETTKDINAFRKEVGSLLANQDAQNPGSNTGSGDASDLSSSQETVVKKTPTSASPVDSKPSSSTMLSELTKRAQIYIDTLDRDLEKIENAAGSYVGKIGKDVKSFLKDAVTVDAPGVLRGDDDSDSGEDAPAEILFDVPEAIRTQIYSTRLDAQLHALHTSTQPFLTTTTEPDYESFAKEFNIDTHTEIIAEDLDKYKPLRTLMESLVPEKVSYNEFWAKYYYMRKQIQDQELRRKILVQKASEQAGDEKDISWEDDEEDEDDSEAIGGVSKGKEPKNSKAPAAAVSNSTSTRSSTDGSYDLVSKTNSTVDLSTTESKPASTSKAIDEKDDEEEEDDWE
ncbi:Dos2p [Sugiyamaella lignohabitans]|uniref:Dos2p n=1 Tax=Sugiyamaella lignohabitans TaxID=796027 RepID=A0A167DSH1_9ASCO|nr:Dos2p [Sugiyamaella lignohabitans]ANB13239.1 Dos2p [Sugiyamaella lignohabitans]